MKSNRLANPMISAAITLLLIGGTQTQASELPREEVRRLVWKQTNPGDVEGWNARQQELQSRADIKPDLFALVDEAYDKEDWERLGPPLLALRLRSDLSSEELSRLVGPLTENQERTGPLDMMTKAFVCGALPVLKHYPSDEHEKLVLSYLARDDTLIQENAINTLAAIGTGQSLPTLKKLSEKLRPAPGNKSRYYEAAVDAVAQIEARIEAVSLQPAAEVYEPRSASGGDESVKASKGTDTRPESKNAIFWWVAVVMIVAAVGLLWLLLKRRS